MFVTFGTLSFDRNKCLYRCKVSWNIIVKEVAILVLKGFGVIYVKFMVSECCDILVLHRQ